ncbi:MAG: motility protein A [Candidatus Neomarinimicrobiota bacterium]|tara:strand:+ start:51 stop:833 length:783 start_codon:yes stop_codon:yes gene_type:complete
MDIALIIGVVLGLGAMGGSMQLAISGGAAGGFDDFIDGPSAGIVLGGMIASIFVAFPMPHVVALGKAMGAVLKPADDKMGPLVDEACDIAEVARKGAADLEKGVDSIKTYFFKDGVQLVVDGMGADEVVDIMETRIEFREKREKLQTDMLKAMGDLAPAWGMVGTLIGLVFMLAGFGEPGGADNLGAGMAAALITTFYGAVFANLFFLPMAQKMGNKTNITSMSSALLVEATKLIAQKKHPLIVREKLNSYIPPAEWKRD